MNTQVPAEPRRTPPSWLVPIGIGLIVALLAVLIVVLLTHHLAERMRANPLIGRILEKVAGMFLLGFGIKLAISK